MLLLSFHFLFSSVVHIFPPQFMEALFLVFNRVVDGFWDDVMRFGGHVCGGLG